MVDKGLSWSAREGVCCSPATAEGGGGALLDEVQEMVQVFLAGRRSGEKWRGRRRLSEGIYGDKGGVERFVAMEMGFWRGSEAVCRGIREI